MIKTPTKAAMTKLLEDLRALAPKRPLSYGEALQVARLQAARLRKWADANEQPDISLTWLTKQRAIPVTFAPSHKLHEESGMTTNAVNGRVEIFINEHEPPVRQRFSLLHELKHGIDFNDFDVLYGRLGSDNATRRDYQVELICNEFSAQVLMPTPLVKRVWLSVQDIDSAALHFNVSPEAMRTRLTKLGLIDRPESHKRHFLRKVALIQPDCCAA